MKPVSLIIISIILSFLFMGCIQTESTPESTAINFLSALKNQKWNTAKRYSTEDSGEIIDILANMMTEEYSEKLKVWKIKVAVKEMDESTSLCSYMDQDGVDMEFLIKKINDKWKVEYRF